MTLSPAFGILTAGMLAEEKDDVLNKAADEAEKLQSFIADQTALLEDLRLHLQNAALSETMDRKVPLREPKDPRLPRLRMVGKRLEIVNAKGAPIDKGDLRLPDGTFVALPPE